MRIELRTILAAAATVALLSGVPGPLMAQQGGPGQLSDLDDDDLVVAPCDLTVDQIDDMKVMTAEGELAGQIEEVLRDASGGPVAVAVEFDDDLVEGGDERIVRLDRLRFEGDRFASDLARSEIGGLPEWDD